MQLYRHKCWTLRLSKFSSCPGKNQKIPQTCFGQSYIVVMWDSRGVKDIRRQCIHHFAWTFVSEKAVFKVGAAFAQLIKNNNVLTIVCNYFKATKRSFCINMWRWMKHRSTTSLWSQIGSQLSGQQQVKAV